MLLCCLKQINGHTKSIDFLKIYFNIKQQKCKFLLPVQNEKGNENMQIESEQTKEKPTEPHCSVLEPQMVDFTIHLEDFK